MAILSYGKAIIIACAIIILYASNGGCALPLHESCGNIASSPKQSKYSKMLSDAEAIEDEIIAIRRELHRKPAIAYEEYAAQELVIEKLTELGLRYLSCPDLNLQSCVFMLFTLCVTNDIYPISYTIISFISTNVAHARWQSQELCLT